MSLSVCPAAVEFALVDGQYPLPSWNDLARQVGIELPDSHPGDMFCEDVDLQAYWPEVTVDWEPKERAGF